ncbi:MAG: UPF0179 family protein [Promethearchaeota archaeon]
MAIVTLIGKRIAKTGNIFVFSGQTGECMECALRRVCCEKLEPERVYVVLNVRDKIHDCPLHEDGVQLVDVEEAPVKVAVLSQQLFEGAIFTFQPKDCTQWSCPNIEVCIPTGLNEGDRVHIEEVIQKSGLVCSLNQKLGCALVRRVL